MQTRFGLITAILLLIVACDGTTAPTDGSVDPGPAAVVFDPAALEGGASFFDFPYPSDLRTDENGHPDLTNFPGTVRGLLADSAALVETERAGFSPITGVYFRFSGAIDASQVPTDPAATDDAESPFVLIDVDPASPERGRRLPAYVHFQREGTRFWPDFGLVIRAVPGVHLHPGRRYAAVIKTGLRAETGDPLLRAPAFDALTRGEGDAALVAHYGELFTELEMHGIARADVLVASSFTISDPAREMDMARAFIMSQPLPAVTGWAPAGTGRYVASVEVYELMAGEPPYDTFGTGRIAFDAEGAPLTVRRRTVQVGLTVPTQGTEPTGGWPVVLYGHGTGGDERTHFTDEGEELAPVGIAMLGFEAALHGERYTGTTAVENLIISNPIAARDMVRQTVIDMMLFFRMLAAGSFDVPDSVAPGGITLARGPVLYMGHSQGAQEAGVLLGVEPTVQSAFLSAGGGGGLITLVDRLFEGQPIACFIAALISESCEVVNENHPALTLVAQPLLDPADPLSFTHRFVRERPADWAPLSLAMTEGTLDEATPPRSIEAMAASIGLPVLETVVSISDPLRITGTTMPGVPSPVFENLTTPSGARVTGGLLQWFEGSHYVIYNIPEATRTYVDFLQSAVAGTPTLRRGG